MPMNVLSLYDIVYLHKLLRCQPHYQLVSSAPYVINRTIPVGGYVIIDPSTYKGVILATNLLVSHVRRAGPAYSLSNKYILTVLDSNSKECLAI